MTKALAAILLLLPALLQLTDAAVVAKGLKSVTEQRNDKNQVCFEGLGCFRNDGNFYHYRYRPISVLPQSPESINTKFALFTRKNKSKQQWIRYGRADLVRSSNFDSAKETKMIVHGFTDHMDSGWMKAMKDALLNIGDYNVILIDWSGGNSFPYTWATANTQVVGAETARLIQWLESAFRARRERFHMIGHSLGSHISGYTGSRLGGRLGRISAMDPAGPYFEQTHPEVRLDRTDAHFVDAIHTDANPIINIVQMKGGFGMMQAVGHVDFYPNGGKQQPGCASSYSAAGRGSAIGAITCNHGFAIDLMHATIVNPGRAYQAIPCDSYENFKAGKCRCGSTGCASLGLNANRWNPNGKHGVTMFLDTTASPPYEKSQ